MQSNTITTGARSVKALIFGLAISIAAALASVPALAQEGSLAHVDTVYEDKIRGTSGFAHATLGGTDYVFVAGYYSNGVNVFSAAADGSLSLVTVVGDTDTTFLGQVRAIETVVSGGNTFLITGGFNDRGISVFSVADDGSLTNVENVADDATIHAWSVENISTATINGTPYIFVVDRSYNGVSVFSVGTDGSLTNTDNVADGGSLELLNPSHSHVATVGGTPYLFVSGGNDAGVSVFSVANDGTLTNTDNVTDGGSLQLSGARHLTTATVDGTTYLFAAGYYDDGASAFSVATDGTLTNVFNVSDDATLELDGAWDVRTHEVGGTTYLYVTGWLDDGVSVFSVANDGSLTNTENIADSGPIVLDGAWRSLIRQFGSTTHYLVTGQSETAVNIFEVGNDGGLTHDNTYTSSTEITLNSPDNGHPVEVGGNQYMIVPADTESTLNVYSLSASGELAFVSRYRDDDTVHLYYTSRVTSAVVNGTTYVFATGLHDDGVSVFSLASDGSLSNVFNIADDATLNLNGSFGLATLEKDGTTYLFAGGLYDDGISVFSVANDGSLTNVANVSDSTSLNLNSIRDVLAHRVGSTDFLFVAGQTDDGVSVFRINSGGTLSNVENEGDTGSRELDGVMDLTIASPGSSYLIASGSSDDGITVFRINSAGTLTHITDIADDATLNLDGVYSTAAVEIGGTTYVYAAGTNDDGLSLFTMASNGTLTNTANISSLGPLTFDAPRVLTPVEINGRPFLSAGSAADGLSILSVAQAPRISSIERQSPAASPTNADSVTWRVTFNEAVQNVTAGDFSLAGSTATLSVNNVSATVTDVTASGGDLANLEGTVTLSFAGGQDIESAQSVALSNTAPTGTNDATYDLDNTAPRIASIERQTPASSPTNADSLTWRVTFDGAVANVGTADFTASGTTGTVSAVTNPSGNAYDVTVSGGDLASFDGTVTLSLAGGQDIADAAGNVLSNTTPTGTNDNSYVVDNTAPAAALVSGITAATDTGSSSTDNITSDSTPILDGTAEANATVTVYLVGGSSLGSTTADGSGDWTFQIPSALSEGAHRFYARATDAAGNAGIGGPASVDITIDESYPGAPDEPDLQAASDDGASSTDNTTTVRRPVFDITGAEAGASLTLVSNIDSVIAIGTASGTGTATLTPPGDLSLGTHTVTVSATDAAGNTGPTSTGLEVTLVNPPPGFAAVFSPDTINEDGISTLTFTIDNTSSTVAATSLDFSNTLPATVTVATPTNASTTCSGGTLTAAAGGSTISYSGGTVATGASCTVQADVTGSSAGGRVNTSGDLTSSLGNSGTASDTLIVNDVVAPRVVSIERFSPASELTTQTSLTWTVTFSEQVSNVTSDDFTVTGGSTASVTNLVPSGFEAYRVTVSGGDINSFSGPVTLAFAGGQDIADTVGNTLTDTAPTGTNEPSYTVDNTFPTLTSIVRQSPAGDTTNADTVTWRLTFSEDVQGVDDGDFSIAEVSGESFSVSGTGAVWDVTASGNNLVNRNGVVTLTVATDIRDMVNQGLTSGVPTGTNNNTYTLDNTGPSISSITRSSPATERTNADSVTWQITFNEAATNVSASDFSLSGTTASLSVASASADQPEYAGLPTTAPAPAQSGSTTYNVTASGGDIAGLDDDIRLEVSGSNTITDVAGNALQSTSVSGTNEYIYRIDNNPASVIEIITVDTATTANSTVSFYYAFTEPVSDVTLDDFEFLTSTGVTVSNLRFGFQSPDSGTILMDVASTAASGTIQGTLKANTDIVDSLGHGNGNVGYVPAYTTVAGAVANVDMQRPTLVSISRRTPNGEQTNADSLSWLVTFSEAVQAVDAADFALTGSTAGLTAALFENNDQPEFAGAVSAPASAPSSVTWLVTATGGDLADANGTVSLALAASPTVNDVVGNTVTDTAASGAVEAYALDNAAPTLTSITRELPTGEQTNADALAWRVEFSEAVTVDASDFAAGGTSATVSVQQVSGDAAEGAAPAPLPTASAWTVTVAGGDLAALNGTVSLALAGSATITDAVGNALTATAATGSVETYTVDNSAPAVTSVNFTSAQTIAGQSDTVTQADALEWTLVFSEPVSNVSADDFSVSGTTGTPTAFTQPQPDTVTVTVSGGDVAGLNGDVTLALAAGSDIADAAGNALASLAGGSADERTITLDNAAPTLTAAGPSGPVNQNFAVTVTVSESVLDSTHVSSNLFQITNGTMTGGWSWGDPGQTEIQFTITPTASGTVTVEFASGAVLDRVGLANAQTSGLFTVTADLEAPRIASITRQSPSSEQTDADSLTWRVTFNEFVEGVDAGDFQIARTTAGLSVAPVASAFEAPGGTAPPPSTTNTFDVTATGGDLANLNGTVTLSALTTGGIADNAGNAFANAAPTGANDNSYSILNDADAPLVASIRRQSPASALTNADSLTWRVAFSEDVIQVDAADFAAVGTTAGVTSVSPVAVSAAPVMANDFGDGGVFTPFAVSSSTIDVTVSGGDLGSLNGAVTLGFAAGQNIADAAGNALADTSPTGANEGYTLDNTAPTVALSSGAATPVAGPFSITITFSEDVTGFEVSDLSVGNGTASGFASTDARTYTATITPGSGATVTVDLAQGAATDGAGNGNTAAPQFSIGYDNLRTMSVGFPGSGAGTVSSTPAGLDCTDDCTADFVVGTDVIVSAIAAEDSTFVEWTDGPCIGTRNENCIVPMASDRSVAARFQLDEPPVGRIVAATLPAARSGYVGGPVMTAFLSVMSQATTPAQGCYVSAASDAPVSLTTQRLDAQGNATGGINPNFDIEPGGTVSFVMGMTPVTETDGYDLYPIIVCENAALDPINGVNSVFLTVESAPVPDILSVSATPSQDGVIRIANPGTTGLMAASAVNIGAGDGSAGTNEITMTTTVDTGDAVLPLTLEICQINSSAVCISPRGPSVTGVVAQNDPVFFAVFARDASGGAGIPFDPANARVFLRFADATGTIRSATSAAVTAPAAGDQPDTAEGLPVGRWSVMLRRPEGEWPSLVRASLHVFADGQAVVHGPDIGVLAVSADLSRPGGFATAAHDGVWTHEGRIRLGAAWSETEGEFWGVRDARGDRSVSWSSVAGHYGDGLVIDASGGMSGRFGDCIVSGRPANSSDSAMLHADVSLMSCAQSGAYRAVIDLPANDADDPALILAGDGRGWRLAAE